MQRRASGAARGAEPEGVPGIVDRVLRSPGRPLDADARSRFEPRFRFDFAGVRVHTDARAAVSARAVGALAYTVGRDIVFGAGQHAPHTPGGRSLLAHELAHVVQQSSGATRLASGVAPADGPLERQAEAAGQAALAGGAVPAAAPAGGHLVQRRISVHKPGDLIPNPGGRGLRQSNAETVRGYLSTLCPMGGVAVDPGTGAVTLAGGFCSVPTLPPGAYGPIAPSPAQASAKPTGCGCLCDINTHPWIIKIDDAGWPQTMFDDDAKARASGSGGSGGTVTAPSPNSPKLWGAGTASGKALDIDPWLVLGHELCGHAWLGNQGRAGPDDVVQRGKGGHQETVARENALRAEHGIELRATFKQPNCGESYWRDKSAPGNVNWSSHRGVCIAWRQDYNRRNGTHYGIGDTIP